MILHEFENKKSQMNFLKLEKTLTDQKYMIKEKKKVKEKF